MEKVCLIIELLFALYQNVVVDTDKWIRSNKAGEEFYSIQGDTVEDERRSFLSCDLHTKRTGSDKIRIMIMWK